MIEMCIENPWMCFVVLVGIALLTSIAMSVLAKKFRTHYGVTRKFSITDLEFPSSRRDYHKIINGIYRLPDSAKILSALRGNLLVDFLFMPAIYGLIFILCMSVSTKMESRWGEFGFQLFAWLQLLAWLLDMIENIYMLSHLKEVKMDQTFKDAPMRAFKYMVHTKWIIALLGGICSSMVLLCFWLEGKYDPANLPFLLIFAIEVVLFVLLMRQVSKVKKADLPVS
jgi:hypothetical protein